MATVIGVRFKKAGKVYYFDPNEIWPRPGDYVVVETARGMEFGEVVTSARSVSDEQVKSPLKKVVRLATEDDIHRAAYNEHREKEAMRVCQEKIAKHKLEMKLVSVEYTFDNSKLIFYFTANGRVDFRELVKDLAGVFKMRIELRQIGVRDEAKMLGGLGSCGRPICCGAFLGDFPAGVDQDGEGAEPLAQPDEDLRPLRPADVLPEVRAGRLRGGAQAPAEGRQGHRDARRRGRASPRSTPSGSASRCASARRTTRSTCANTRSTRCAARARTIPRPSASRASRRSAAARGAARLSPRKRPRRSRRRSAIRTRRRRRI